MIFNLGINDIAFTRGLQCKKLMSYCSFSENYIYDITRREVRQISAFMGQATRLDSAFFGLNQKSLAKKLTD